MWQPPRICAVKEKLRKLYTDSACTNATGYSERLLVTPRRLLLPLRPAPTLKNEKASPKDGSRRFFDKIIV